MEYMGILTATSLTVVTHHNVFVYRLVSFEKCLSFFKSIKIRTGMFFYSVTVCIYTYRILLYLLLL